jgi:hypothetical protein
VLFVFRGRGCYQGTQSILSPFWKMLIVKTRPLLPFPKDVIGGLAYPANKYGLVLHEKS